MSVVPSPADVAEVLSERVVGQETAVREMAIALVKKLGDLPVGNVLMIGSSGSGKTTLMRAVEETLAARAQWAPTWPLIRVHANVLSEDSARQRPGEKLLHRLLQRAREQAPEEDPQKWLERAQRGVVFVDEVDKIRTVVGGQVNVDGVRAQESLLTLIENEAVPLALPAWAGGGQVTLDASRLLFVCAGAFEGLYDAVYDRVTVGKDRGSLQAVSVVGEGGEVEQQFQFRLREWLRQEDLFEYGMSPQFLSRFDAVVLLNDLSVDHLIRIFLESPESGLAQARAYFASQNVDFAISPDAVRRIAVEAARNQRLGARALREVFRRVIRDYEFDPSQASANGTLAIDLPEVEAALAS